MKVIVLFVALLTLFVLSSAKIQSRVIDLRVNHFDPLDRRTFDVHYLVNSEYFVAGGPIFIYLPGRSVVTSEFLESGAVYEIAEETNGHLFSLEHRYYGSSRPTADTSVDNLRWLTYHQALADLAEFIFFIKANYNGASNSRVILWGRGWGGALAVWARQKYPNLIDGVWASSAHIDIVLYYPEHLSNTFDTITSIGGPECGEILHSAFRIIEDAIRLTNISYVEERLNLCSPIDIHIEEDVARLFYGISSDIGYTFMPNARYPEVEDKCEMMRGLNTPQNPPENGLDAFARWYVDDYNGNADCLDFSNTRNQKIEWDTDSTITGGRQNAWFQCTQGGQFPIANEGKNHPFGWRFDLAFFKQYCSQLFGEELFTTDFIEESILRSNKFFGGLNPNVYRVFFTHGEMDPRRNLGPSRDLNANSPVAVMPLQSWGRDFGSPSATDDEILLQTKARARELILQWINDATQNE